MLREYRAKRDFHSTPEPASDERSRAKSVKRAAAKPAKRSAAKPAKHAEAKPAKRVAAKRADGAGGCGARFVVHEHHARRLHWDLRLEHDGALMSWAIPNGIPCDPRENRKAIHVEDHPLAYLDFEGEIPRGSYGAGRVLIWDRGSYDCEKRQDDELIVVFHGGRLRGRYALFRTGTGQDWMIHRMDPPDPARAAMPEHLLPMLADSGRLPRQEAGWAFEVKWDGVRAIAYCKPGRMRIDGRNLNDISVRYPELRGLGRQLGMREAVLDGEIVAFDERGAPSFERLQGRMHLTAESAIRRLARDTPVTYVIFDLLYLEGRPTLELAYQERRELLEQLDLNGAAWRTPAYRVGDGRELLAATAEHGLEGLVAKRLRSLYRPGERGAQWLKIKNTVRQELVIGGWLPGKGRRSGQLGALLMGYQEGAGKARMLRYAGRVGTGFDEAELERLASELGSRQRRRSPFAEVGVQPPREARFVEPELVAEIEFSHWTRERVLRHSVYRGLRTDKPAAEVALERFVPSSAPASPQARRRAPRQIASEAVRGEAKGGGADLPYKVLHETKRYTEVQVQDRTLRLSNRDKVLYPKAGFTKGQLVDYYAALAPVLLPHLAGRPLTLKRYPDGVEGEYFYEKRCPTHRPAWVQTAAIWSDRQQEPIDYCLVEDLPTLIWVANLADIELHPSLSRARDMDTPATLVFDLDPGAPAALKECCRVALWIRELLDAFDLRTLVKSSGAKGMQVYLPLNTAVSYEQTKQFARAVAELLQKQHPELVTARMAKSLRPGRVLIDWSQNDPHKTTVGVYSLRAEERPMVSTPLHWEEVERGARRRRELELSVEPPQLLKRVERDGDLHAPLLTLRQSLPDLSGGRSSRFYKTPREGISADKQVGEQGDRGRPGPRGRTREQLYQEARKLGVEGRSNMNKAQLQRAIEGKQR